MRDETEEYVLCYISSVNYKNINEMEMEMGINAKKKTGLQRKQEEAEEEKGIPKWHRVKLLSLISFGQFRIKFPHLFAIFAIFECFVLAKTKAIASWWCGLFMFLYVHNSVIKFTSSPIVTYVRALVCPFARSFISSPPKHSLFCYFYFY